MKCRYVLFVFSMYSCIQNSCYAAILVKFGRPVEYRYGVVTEKRGSSISNTSENEEIVSHNKQVLCDAVSKAKQFTLIQYKNRFERHNENWNSTRDPPQPDLNVLVVNYPQRCALQPISPPDYSSPEQRGYPDNLSTDSKEINCWLCVNTTKGEEWMLAHDSRDHHQRTVFMFEHNHHKDGYKSDFRLTGIYERTPKVHEKSPTSEEYFLSQFQTSRDKMESVCELALDDRLRLCSAIFEALMEEMNLKGGIAQMNYVTERRCLSKNILPEITPSPTRILRCALAEDGLSQKFYVLVDSRERGAAFVFPQNESGQLEAQIRLTEVGALLNPIRPKEGEKIAKDCEMEGEYDKLLTSKSKRKNADCILDEEVLDMEELPMRKLMFKEASDSASENEPKIKLLIDLNELPTEEVFPMGEGTTQRKIGRPPTKNSGRMNKTELEAKLREVWRTYNPKYRRNRGILRKGMPNKNIAVA